MCVLCNCVCHVAVYEAADGGRVRAGQADQQRRLRVRRVPST